MEKVGLQSFPREQVPSEESIIKFLNVAKAATKRGRKFIGSSEGEGLQVSALAGRPVVSQAPAPRHFSRRTAARLSGRACLR